MTVPIIMTSFTCSLLHTRVSHRLPLGVLIKAKARLVFIVCRGEVLCVDGGVLKLHNECDTSRRHTCHVLLLTAQFGGRLRTRGQTPDRKQMQEEGVRDLMFETHDIPQTCRCHVIVSPLIRFQFRLNVTLSTKQYLLWQRVVCQLKMELGKMKLSVI